MNRVGEGHWVMLRAQLQRRSGPFDAMIENMTPRRAWYAFDTVRRWHAHGHAERAKSVFYSVAAQCGIAVIEGFRYIESTPSAPP